jgi:hypothetical protein
MESFRPFGKTVQVKDGKVILNDRNFIFFFQKVISLYAFILKRKKVEPSSIEHLVSKLFHLYKINGINFLILYLKTALWALNCFVGNIPLRSTKSSGTRIKLANGLPSILPPVWRKEIRRNNIAVIRLCACILNVYKALEGKYATPDLSSILNPMPELPNLPEFTEFCKKFFKHPVNKVRKPIGDFIDEEPPLIFTAGPNNPVSMFGFMEDNIALRHHKLWSPILDFAEAIDFTCRGFAAAMQDYLVVQRHLWDEEPLYEKGTLESLNDPKLVKVGKLSLKYEAAGKVRVFAIGDYYTQWVLRPLHNVIFHWLKNIHSDATFNQNEVLSTFMMNNRNKRFWSFDLKSATDLIPRPLYLSALSFSFLTEKTAKLWEEILNRDFALPEELEFLSDKNPPVVRYQTGQPMGFLSSWAALALVHHLLVRFAWFRLHDNYTIPNHKYLVLGDDLVISDKDLAEEYLKVVQLFSIPITRYKSYENATIANFASQTWTNKGENISPLSLKEIIQCDSLSKKLEFANRLARLGYIETSLSSLFRSFFHPELWKTETPLLTKGQLSPYGRRVYRCLCQPNGRTDLISTYLSSFEQRPSVFNPPTVPDKDEYLTGFPIRNDKRPHLTAALQQINRSLSVMLADWQGKTFEVLKQLQKYHGPRFVGDEGMVTHISGYEQAYQGLILTNSEKIVPYGESNYRMSINYDPDLEFRWVYTVPYNRNLVLQRLRESYFLYMHRLYIDVILKSNNLGYSPLENGDKQPKFSPLKYITDLFNLVNTLTPHLDLTSLDSAMKGIRKKKSEKYHAPRENITTRMILGVLFSISDISTWYSPPKMVRSTQRKSRASRSTRISKSRV